MKHFRDRLEKRLAAFGKHQGIGFSPPFRHDGFFFNAKDAGCCANRAAFRLHHSEFLPAAKGAQRFLEQAHDEDFLLAVSYDEPHHPFVCPEPYASMYRDYRFPKRPNVWDTLADKPEHHRAWAGDAVHR